MELKRRYIFGVLLMTLALSVASPASLAQNFITVASTTSTEQSGLFKHLLPAYEKKTGVQVRVVALGTGQALDMARRGDADVVFVHARAAEEKFIAEGYGVKRLPVMYNDFVLVGPKSDPAKVAGGKDIVEALRKVKAHAAPFVSRGDRSGTHMANSASSMNGYILTDRATWISFKNRGDLTIVVEGDKRLFNQYGVILVNPEKHKHVKKDLGQAFIDWVVSPDGQKAIADYKIGSEQLFFPNANDAGA
jgi:tungstate transport system substrate-binding protein